LKHPARKQKVATYFDENLETLSPLKLLDVLWKDLIPNYIKDVELCFAPLEDELADAVEDSEVQSFLLDCGIKKLCDRTCLSE
jgi:hypothetical protein